MLTWVPEPPPDLDRALCRFHLGQAWAGGRPSFGRSGYAALPDYFDQRLRPALEALLKSAAKAEQVREGVDADELLLAIAKLLGHGADGDLEPARRMVRLLVGGLRYGAKG